MTFAEDWARFHPGERPVGWMLREDRTENWLRFHSLPTSKRYADSDDERAIILDRHNALALKVLGPEPCWLVQTHWVTPQGSTDAADANDPFRATRDWKLGFAFEFVESEEEDSISWRTYATQTRWRPGCFDDLLLSVAVGDAGPTLWMGENGAIFAPYDGGVDLFLRDPSAVHSMKTRFADWLPLNPSGL